MKRIALVVACLFCFASPAFAITEFAKQWKKEYAPKDGNEEFYNTAKKANCNICHVKGHPDKKKARNEYGKAIHKFLDKKDFPKDFLKSNPEKAKEMILEGFKKAGELKSEDGKTFGEKIKSLELPATDSGL